MRDRLILALESCALLAVPVVSFELCLVAFRRSVVGVLGIASVPVACALICVFLLILVDSAITTGKTIRFPLNFTLPAILMSITWCTATLFTISESRISGLGSQLAPMALWTQPEIVALVFVCQVAALTVASYFQKSGNAPSLP